MNERVRETAILTTAREMDNQFEWVAHEPAARKAGVPTEVVDIIKQRRSAAHLSEPDITIIELGRQLFERRKVESDLFARALNMFGERQLVELVMLMGHYAAVAALLTAFDVQLPEGLDPPLPPRPSGARGDE
jgi:4-carboxymuconolactone decarboxylase